MTPHSSIQVFLNIKGYTISDPSDFSTRFFKIYNSALGIPRDAKVEEFKVQLEDEENKKEEEEEKEDL